jgi:hypothetical protein
MPCHAAKNISVITWDNVLLPKNLNRLNTYLKKKERIAFRLELWGPVYKYSILQ